MMQMIEAAFVLIIIGVAIVSLGRPGGAVDNAAKKRLQKNRARKSGVPKHLVRAGIYQPLELRSAWREPLEFEATTLCPHCGKMDTHRMFEPRPDTYNYRQNSEGVWRPVAYPPWVKRKDLGDHPQACTVRRCGYCGHIWGEK